MTHRGFLRTLGGAALAAVVLTAVGVAAPAVGAATAARTCDVTLGNGAYGTGIESAGHVCVTGDALLAYGAYSWTSVDVEPGGALVVTLQDPCAAPGPGTLTLSDGGTIESGGTLALSDTSNCFGGGEADLIVAGGTLTNHGTIAADACDDPSGCLFGSDGGAGGRGLSGDIVNEGTVQSAADTPVTYAGGTFTNRGAVAMGSQSEDDGFTVGPGTGATFVNGAGGSIDASAGDFVMDGGNTFVQGDGTITGTPPLLTDDTVHYTGTGASHVAVRGATTVSGNIASGQTLELQGAGGFCQFPGAVVTAATGFTNAGLIETTQCNSAPGLTITSGTLTNTGTIDAQQGLTLSGNVNNRGTVTADGGSTITQTAGTFTEQGAMNIDGAYAIADNANATFKDTGGQVNDPGSFTVGAGNAFVQGGGVIGGTAVLMSNGGNLSFTGSGAAQVSVRGDITLAGNIAASQTLDLQGQGGFCQFNGANVTSATGFTNSGLIETTQCNSEPALTLTSGGLVNKGTIDAQAGLALHTTLTNPGTLIAGYGATVALDGLTNYSAATSTLAGGTYDVGGNAAQITLPGFAVHTNNATVSSNGGTLRATDGSDALRDLSANHGNLSLANFGTEVVSGDLTNTGTITLSSADTYLRVDGDYRQTAAGTFVSEIDSPSSYGQLEVSGTAHLAGTLTARKDAGYAPAVGDTQQVVTYAARTGHFSSVTGIKQGTARRYFVLEYDAGAATFVTRTSKVTVNPSSGAAGAPFTVTGSGFSPHEAVALSIGSTSLGAAHANASGSFTASETTPALAPGAETVEATGNTSDLDLKATYTVE